jgi:hypothetical protein
VRALASVLGGSRRRALALWLLAGSLAGGAWLAIGWLPRPEGSAYTICALRRVAGIPCPGCGMTRALGALARGDLTSAVAAHPLAIPLVLELAALWLLAGWLLWRGRPLAVPAGPLQAALIWHGVAFLAVWLGRAATGTLPW